MMFCFGEGQYSSSGIGYQNNYHVFNKPVDKEVYDAIDRPYIKLDWTKYKNFKAAFQAGWEEAPQEERDKVLNLPNFDAELFKEHCGVDISEQDSAAQEAIKLLESKGFKIIKEQSINLDSMNKYEQLIDKLADKTLSFGQSIHTERGVERVIGGEYESIMLAFDVCDCTEITTLSGLDHDNVVGHPIYIGDVLAKIEEIKGIDVWDADKNLLVHWGACGFSKSLQEIYEGTKLIDCGCKDEKHDYLADPNAEALLDYLINLDIV